MNQVNNRTLPFPLKHVGTWNKKVEERAEHAIRHCFGVPTENLTANDWRVLSVLRTRVTTDANGDYESYITLSLQHDRLLNTASGMEEVAVEHLPLFRYAKKAVDMESPSTVWVDDKCVQSLTVMEGENRKVKHLKIRHGRCKIMALMQYVRAWIAEQTGEDITLNESNIKTYIESLTSQTFNVYAVDELDCMDTATFENVVGLIYGLHARTNTTSCMVKGDARTNGDDYYKGFLHPFHCYRTEAWSLLLVSDKTPEQMEQVDFGNDEVKSPFLARAWATTGDTGLYYTYKFYGAKDAIEAVDPDKEVVLLNCKPTHEPLRLYEDAASGSYVCAYIDGHNYVGMNSHPIVRKDKDGRRYVIGHACEEYNDYDYTYEPHHASGLTEEHSTYVHCSILEEDYPEDQCEYSHELGGYVHRDFWDYKHDRLNGYAIYCYYNS